MKRFLLALLFLCTLPALSEAVGPHGPTPYVSPTSGGANGRAMLIVGDSNVGGRHDEAFAQPNVVRTGGGLPVRMAAAVGLGQGGNTGGVFTIAMGSVHYGSAITSGTLFGANAEFDLVGYVRLRPEISDVVIFTGTNDFYATCAHGSPFDPTSAASGACTVDQYIANMKYLFDALLALPNVAAVHQQMPVGWLGHFLNSASPGQATYQDAIQRSNDELVTYCAGRKCYPGAEMYMEACAGDNTANIDPTAGTNCTNTNNVNYGDGAALNKLNRLVMFHEDALFKERTTGTSSHIHLNGWGHTRVFQRLLGAMAADDANIGLRFSVFGEADLLSAAPPIPVVTIGTTTATSIVVTPTRGLGQLDAASGTDGECGSSACVNACWATCVDTDLTSDDPACATSGETAVARDLGAPSGAGHYVEDAATWTQQPRDVLVLQDGEAGTLRGLKTGTSYKVACVAFGHHYLKVSHPGVRNVTTP